MPTRRRSCAPNTDSRDSGLKRLTLAAYALLGLITFFTADEDKEAMARSLTRGSYGARRRGRGPHRARRRVRQAEVIGWEDLIASGGYGGARDRGLLRIEGRDYVVRDGDVITIRV